MTCGIFQINFYDNLFNPNKNGKTQDKKRLIKRTIETLRNELFILDDQRQFNSTRTKITSLFSHLLKKRKILICN